MNLASLPDFLRTPILKKRMTEFFSKNDEEKAEIIVNALNAGPTIPFPNFSKFNYSANKSKNFITNERRNLCASIENIIIKILIDKFPFPLDNVDSTKSISPPKMINEINTSNVVKEVIKVLDNV